MDYDPKLIVQGGESNQRQFVNMPKVLIIGPVWPSTGGIPTYVDSLLSSELREQYLFEVLDTYAVKKRLNKQESHFSLKEINASFRVINIFIKFVRKFDPALVHIHTSSYWGFYEKSILLLIAKFIFRKKTILHIHGGEFGFFYKKSISKNLINWILEQATKTLIVSKMYKEMIAYKKVIAVDNCVRFDSKVFSVDKSILRKKYKIPKEKTVFLSAVLLLKKKGINDTLVAFKNIFKERDDFYFIIAGEGPEKSRILDFIESSQLNRNVKVMDFITGQIKEDIFLLSDVFILNSTAEALSVAQLETLSYGLFMITTPVGIASDAERVFNDENSMLIPINDTKALEMAILKVLDKTIDTNKITKKNFYDFKDRFDTEPVFEKMRIIYDEVLNKN